MAREADLGSGGGSFARREPGSEIEPARRGGILGFLHESYAELKKVEWPTQNQVIQGTIVVLVACVIVGAFLYVNDQIWKRVVAHLI